MTEASGGGPAWLPDPTGRHQLRWHDGRSFTDRVADDGAIAVDAGPSAPPPPPITPWTPPAPPAQPSWGPAPATTPGSPPGRSRLPIVLGLAGATLVAAGGVAFLLTRGDDGTGTFDGRVEEASPLGTHEVALDAGDVLLVTLRPGGDLDAVLGVLVADDDADALERAYDEVLDLDRQSPAAGLATGTDDLDDGLELLLRTDLGFAGEPELLLLAVPEDLDVTVVVGPFEPESDEDDYEIEIDRVALAVEEGADGEELLEAIADDTEIAATFRAIAEELLDEG